jgi:mannose-6-phosphate isomerase-like protein (cupin superfamily)
VESFDVAATADRLSEHGGGHDVVHTSPGLEIGVYVLVAPNPAQHAAHAFDSVYVVLDGDGEVDVGGVSRPVTRGQAVFVAAGTEHHFHAYENELVLIVIFNGPDSASRNG